MGTFKIDQEHPVNALALNKDNTQVAIGGRNVFKVYQIGTDGFKEICNLRASKHLNLSFSCNDVAWSSTDDNYLATAATNGHVCVWNLTKMGKAMQEQVYQEHKRTVNKVNFHASEPNRLISGSQDGTMRYFDIRCKAAVAIFFSNTESVRDVQFSPHLTHTFAAVSENGSVQLWDVRRTDKCQQQFTAHSGPVFACDWHPECSWLATASRDRTIKVWDLTTKPTLDYTIHTIAAIAHVKWRPQRRYHIASCALVVDCSINVWDIRRPYIPFASFNEHKDIASGVAWRGDPHVFLSTGRDCSLYQHSFEDAFRPATKANPQTISLNNKDQLLCACRVPTNVSYNHSIPKGYQPSRKTSTTTMVGDQFHQASSIFQEFRSPLWRETDHFIYLATRYKLTGQSFSDICEHNAAVAKECGKNNVSVIWRIINTMYGEEFQQNMINLPNINVKRDDAVVTIPNSTIMDHIHENEQCPGGADTPVAQFSGGDDETETEDQVDHAVIYAANGPLSYSTSKQPAPKGDFSFGENELDIELDKLSVDYRNGILRSTITPHLSQQPQDWTLPNEAFHIRHELLDRTTAPNLIPSNATQSIAPSASTVTVLSDGASPDVVGGILLDTGGASSDTATSLSNTTASGGERMLERERSGSGSASLGGGPRNSGIFSDPTGSQEQLTTSDSTIPHIHKPPSAHPQSSTPSQQSLLSIPPQQQQSTTSTFTQAIASATFWDPSGVVSDALRHHAAMGDIQTAACLLTVLGERRAGLSGRLGHVEQEQWLGSYVDVLSRCKLWNVATQIIKLSWLPAIHQLNQQSTRFNSCCGQCSKPLQRSGWLCDRCHTSTATALCSVCHQVVRGLYAWCQGCAHGGHLVHMQQWMRKNRKCPTGCGHLCEYR